MKLLLLLALLQPAEKTHFEHGFSAYEAVNYNAAKWPPEFIEDPDTIDADFIEKNVERWIDRLVKQGATMIGVTVFDSDNVLYMNSPTLTGLRFRSNEYDVDILDIACKYALKRKVAVDVGLEGLRRAGAQALSQIAPGLLKDLAAYKDKYDGLDLWVNESGFDAAMIGALAETAADNGIKYLSFGIDPQTRPDIAVSKDYATYPRELSEDRPEYALWREISKIGVTGMGAQTLAFAAQQSAGKKSGVGVSGHWGLATGVQPNVALFRAVQYAPAFYTFIPGWMEDQPEANRKEEEYVWKYDYDTTLAPLIKLYARAAADSKKPVANLLILQSLVPDGGRAFWSASMMSSLDMVTNALTAAGYEIVLSRDPLESADLYYILAPAGGGGLNVDFPRDLLPLLEGPKKIVVHPIGFVADVTGWNTAAGHLGLPRAVRPIGGTRDASSLPEKVAWTFPGGAASVRYRGYQLFSSDPADPVGTSGALHVASNFTDIKEATVHASGRVKPADGNAVTLAVLTERKGKFLVNGNFVHFEFSCALANALAREPVFHRPTYAYVSLGADRSALFAADDTGVDVVLPGGSKIAQFDASGRQIAAGKVTLEIKEGRLTGSLKKWELAIVTK